MNDNQIIIYKTEDGVTKIDVRLENETVWLSLDQIAELFQRDNSPSSKTFFICLEMVDLSL